MQLQPTTHHLHPSKHKRSAMQYNLQRNFFILNTIIIWVLFLKSNFYFASSFHLTTLHNNCKNVKNVSLFVLSQSTATTTDQELITPKDHDDVYEQLGYIPTNLVSIAARRRGGYNTPMVLKTYPLNGGASRRKAKAEGSLTPFPTLYWFCCKDVSKAIADLERRGYVGKLEERLCNEPGTFEQFMKSHASYAKERWGLLSMEHQQYILDNERMLRILRDSGIAGTEYKSFQESKIPSIKCLHAHYGHYRAQMERGDVTTMVSSNGSFTSSQITNKNNENIQLKSKGDNDTTINIVGQWIDELLQTEYPNLPL